MEHGGRGVDPALFATGETAGHPVKQMRQVEGVCQLSDAAVDVPSRHAIEASKELEILQH